MSSWPSNSELGLHQALSFSEDYDEVSELIDLPSSNHIASADKTVRRRSSKGAYWHKPLRLQHLTSSRSMRSGYFIFGYFTGTLTPFLSAASPNANASGLHPENPAKVAWPLEHVIFIISACELVDSICQLARFSVRRGRGAHPISRLTFSALLSDALLHRATSMPLKHAFIRQRPFWESCCLRMMSVH